MPRTIVIVANILKVYIKQYNIVFFYELYYIQMPPTVVGSLDLYLFQNYW